MAGKRFLRVVSFASLLIVLAAVGVPQACADIITGDATNFAVLYEGAGNNHLSTTNVTINGNIGIGAPSGTTTAQFSASGPGTINGGIQFAGAVNESISNTTITGAITGNNANVQTDLNNLNSLSTTLGGEAGTSLSVNLNNLQSQTVNATSGILNGTNYVFDVSSFTFNNGATLTINNNGVAGDSVVFNFASNAQFGGTILLSGFTDDQVLFNFIGGSNLSGGPTLQINSNGAVVQGDFLDPNGPISVVHSVLDGRVFGGDSHDMQIVSGGTLNAPPASGPPPPPPPIPEPASIALLGTALLAFSIFVKKRIA
jgi:hypothetical protein